MTGRSTRIRPTEFRCSTSEELYNRKDLENAITAHKKALSKPSTGRGPAVVLRRADQNRTGAVHLGASLGGIRFGTEGALRSSWTSCIRWSRPKTMPMRKTHAVRSASWRSGRLQPEPDTENPLAATPRTAQWPPDPLGARRGAVEAGAASVLSALASLPQDSQEAEEPEDDPENWASDVDVLLAEREARANARAEVILPAQLSVTQLVDLKADPDELAARLRRPLPYPPNPLARRGTAFSTPGSSEGSVRPDCWISTNYPAPRIPARVPRPIW